MILQTDRLVLRPWKKSDLIPFAKMNADLRVREFFPSIQTKEESDGIAMKLKTHIEKNGWGFWATELKDSETFIGFIGIEEVSFKAHFTPAVEIGWRLAYEHWGRGYATEGAKAALNFGFNTLKLPEIVSFAVPENLRSIHVMETLGMKKVPNGDFVNPQFPTYTMVLYRLKVEDYQPHN